MKEIDRIERLVFRRICSKSSWQLLARPASHARSTVLISLVVGMVLGTEPVGANSVKEVNSSQANRYWSERVSKFSPPSTETNLQPLLMSPDNEFNSSGEQIDFSDTGRPIESTSFQESRFKDRVNLDFSTTGRPGQRTAGGSRNNCLNPNFSLTALLPASHLGKTVAERPTFWFYIPYLSQSPIAGEFVLQDENRQDVYRIPFQLDRPAVDVAGLVPFSPPKTTAPLQSDRLYRWYFKLYCQSNKTSSPIFVQGWVQRVALEPRVKLKLAHNTRPDLVYAENGIWYDALDYLAQLRLHAPNSKRLENDWQKLLTAKGVNLKLPK